MTDGTEGDEHVGTLEAIIEQLRARVDERRSAGEYPEGLEQELDAHFARIVAHRPARYDQTRLRMIAELVAANVMLSPERIDTASSLPGGSSLHAAVGRVVSRQTAGVLQQVQEFASAVLAFVNEVVAAMEHPHGHEHADLVGQIDALFDRLVDLERAPDDSVAAVADLRRRVEELEAERKRRSWDPWFAATDFQQAFRGSSEDLKERYADVADRLKGATDVVDIGCGSGEFLQLLLDRGIGALGIEADASLVARGREMGLPVEEGDAVGWLAARDDGSLDAIVLLQVVEHLTPQEVLDVIVLSERKLREGGRLLIETVNPQSLYVYAHPFYLDPTHTTPIHPAYLEFLLSKAGFRRVETDWRSPPPDDDRLEPVEGAGGGVHTRNVERLNRILFAPQDYLIVGER